MIPIIYYDNWFLLQEQKKLLKITSENEAIYYKPNSQDQRVGLIKLIQLNEMKVFSI